MKTKKLKNSEKTSILDHILQSLKLDTQMTSVDPRYYNQKYSQVFAYDDEDCRSEWCRRLHTVAGKRNELRSTLRLLARGVKTCLKCSPLKTDLFIIGGSVDPMLREAYQDLYQVGLWEINTSMDLWDKDAPQMPVIGIN